MTQKKTARLPDGWLADQGILQWGDLESRIQVFVGFINAFDQIKIYRMFKC